MYMKKLNISCGPARCLKLVIWPTDKNVAHPWFRRSWSDKTGQTLALHRYGTKKQCGT